MGKTIEILRIYTHWLIIGFLRVLLKPFCKYVRKGSMTLEFTDNHTEDLFVLYEDQTFGFREVRTPLKYMYLYLKISWLILKYECYSWSSDEFFEFLSTPQK